MKGVVVGVLLVAALAGCGGGGKHAQPTVTAPHPHAAVAVDKAAYDTMMQRLGHRLSASMKNMYPIVDTQPGAAASLATAAKIEQTEAVVVSVTEAVRAIVPPPPIRADHQRLVQGLHELGVELNELIHVLKKGGPKPFGAYASFASLRTIGQVTANIQKKGYAIDG